VVVVVGKTLTFTPALQTSLLPESTQVYFIFEYTTTCPFVAQEVFAAGFVALVAVAIGKKIDALMNASSAKYFYSSLLPPTQVESLLTFAYEIFDA